MKLTFICAYLLVEIIIRRRVEIEKIFLIAIFNSVYLHYRADEFQIQLILVDFDQIGKLRFELAQIRTIEVDGAEFYLLNSERLVQLNPVAEFGISRLAHIINGMYTIDNVFLLGSECIKNVRFMHKNGGVINFEQLDGLLQDDDLLVDHKQALDRVD